jgi:FkbM family methyltransferase
VKLIYKFFRLITAIKITNQNIFTIFEKGFSIASSILAKNLQLYCGENINTVFDVGANKGQFAIAMTKISPKSLIYSFEPTKQTFNNLSQNTSNYKNITCYNLALGESIKDVDFYESDYSHANSILPISEFQKSQILTNSVTTTSKIKMTTFDEVFKGLNVVRPILLKLDVQGYEKEVLKGAELSLDLIDYVLIETSFVSFYDGEPLFGEMYEYLLEKGFEVVAPLDTFQTDSMQIVQMDMLYKKKIIII